MKPMIPGYMKSVIPGFNPIIWDCGQRGCWNTKCRPNIEFFKGALPRKIAMTDIDGTVEVNGSFLFMEWKSYVGKIPTGQRIYFQRLTKISDKITAVIVAGDAETMRVDSIQRIHGGKIDGWIDCDLEELFERVGRWAHRADVQVVTSLSGKARAA